MRLIDVDELLDRMERCRRNSADVPFIKCQNVVDAVRVVHGKWLNSNGDFSEAICSVCGYRIDTTHDDAGSKTIFDAAKRTMHYCS